MQKLDGVSAETLRDHLHVVEEPKAVRRLMVALSYKDGESVRTLSDRFGIPASTIYHWLDRFENRPIADAVGDTPRPGRPPKLDAETRAAFLADLQAAPATFGYGDADWSAELARTHLERTYDVEYSVGHVRRLMDQYGRDD